MAESSHAARRLEVPSGWTVFIARAAPCRLVVFVHGFRGAPLDAWRSFFEPDVKSAWWKTADLLFVGYDSKRRSITAVAHELLHELPRFYPVVRDDLSIIEGSRVRPDVMAPYDELVLVGHSLGGVIIRHAVADAVERLADDGDRNAEAICSAVVRMFSPASAGFQAAGPLGLARATPGIWTALEMYLRRSSAYSDLQPESTYLRDLRWRTERLAALHTRTTAIRPRILWADPDDVVICSRYASDPPDDSEPGQSHRSICKPSGRYTNPFRFVETGRRT